MSGKRVRITQLRSGIGYDQRQRAALRGLGLRRIRHSVERENTAAVRGLIRKVIHLVRVEDV